MLQNVIYGSVTKWQFEEILSSDAFFNLAFVANSSVVTVLYTLSII